MARSSSRLILISRLGLLLLAAAGLIATLAVTAIRQHGRSGIRYVCPMHPQVSAPTAGECPICHMALVPAAARAPVASATGAGETQTGRPGSTSSVSVFPETVSRSRTDSIELVKNRVLSQELRAPATVDRHGQVVARLYRDELAGLEPAEPVMFWAAGAASQPVAVHALAEAAEPWDESTLTLHFRVDPAGPTPAADAVGWIVLAPRPREVLVVSDAAVLESSEGPYALVVSGSGGRFERRSIEVGRGINGMVVVTSGLSAGERVAASQAFFVDAERRLRVEPGPDATLESVP